MVRKPFTRTVVVTLSFATFMLTLDSKNIIIGAPPIMRNWMGQSYQKLYLYYERKGKLIKAN